MTTATANLTKTSGNWITGRVGIFSVQAKVFELDSDEYGMAEDARISKLWIKSNDNNSVLYDYDRGDLMVNRLDAETLARIVSAVTA